MNYTWLLAISHGWQSHLRKNDDNKEGAVLMVLFSDIEKYGLRMRRECRERFSPPPRVSDPDMHPDTCVTHVPRCMPGSQTSGWLWSRWRVNRSRHSRRMRNVQYYVSYKRSIALFSHHMYHTNIFQTKIFVLAWNGDPYYLFQFHIYIYIYE